MYQALTANLNSYYRNTESLGSEEDFVTSPEISQLFGEMIGLWCIEQWYELGRPTSLNLVELGPGRGLLMRDLLKVARKLPDFFNALNIELVEVNPHFTNWQSLNLSQYKLNINWLSSVDQIKPLPTIIIANEFFDALPIKQYVMNDNQWHEVVVKIDSLDNKLKFDKVSILNEMQSDFFQKHPNAKDGSIVEQSQESLEIAKFISKHIDYYSGSALIIDYGYNIESTRTSAQYQNTLQAIKKHKYQNILTSLGAADLSAHVDFHAIKTIISNNAKADINYSTQRSFLLKYGIIDRVSALKQSSIKSEHLIIENQLNRLISTNEMGDLFKVLSIISKHPL